MLDGWTFVLRSVSEALGRLWSLDPEVLGILGLSLKVAVVATVLGMLAGAGVAFLAHLASPRWRNLLSVLLQGLLSVPTVMVGTVVYLFLSRSGPLGALGWLYSPAGIILGDLFLVIPFVAVFLLGAFGQVHPEMLETAVNLGARRFDLLRLLLRQCRGSLGIATCAAFGRVISEVGAAMILGGNIKGLTRTLTTAMALETGKGETGLALALGLVLLAAAFGNTLFIAWLKVHSSAKVFSPPLPGTPPEGSPRGGEPPAGARDCNQGGLRVGQRQDGALSRRGAPPPEDVALPAAGPADGLDPQVLSAPPSLPDLPPIRIEEVGFGFPGNPVLENISGFLPLTGGVALFGRSGVGKTTLLRLLAGLARPDRGRIDLGGRQAVLVFQKPTMFPGTVAENMSFGPTVRGFPKAASDARVGGLAQRLGIAGLLARSARGLSGGEMARVALGRALAVFPDLLLLDETLVHLDAGSLARIFPVLHDYLHQGGGLVFVTHHEDLARRLCRQAFRLESGSFHPVW